MLWIKEVEMVDSVDDLTTSQSIGGHTFPNFEMLDAKSASVLKKIIMSSNFKKKISQEEEKAQLEDRFLRGRQIVYLIYDDFRVTGALEAVLDFTDLFSVTLRGDDVQDFDTRYNEVLSTISEVPNGKIWKVCARCEYESLMNEKQCWPCTSKKSIKIHRSRVIRSWRPW